MRSSARTELAAPWFGAPWFGAPWFGAPWFGAPWFGAPWFGALFALACGLGLATPRGLLALTAVALVGLAVALLASRAGIGTATGPLTGRVVALREKAWSAEFHRQRDPDAAGRPRPRAPSAAPAAA